MWVLGPAFFYYVAGGGEPPGPPGGAVYFDDYADQTVALIQAYGATGGSLTPIIIDQSPDVPVLSAIAGTAQQSVLQGRIQKGSVAFGGSGDYIVLPGSANTGYDLGDTYTIEMWVMPISQSANYGIITRGDYNSTTLNWTGLTFAIRRLTTPALKFYFYGTTSGDEQTITINGDPLITGGWNHIAVVRNNKKAWVLINGMLLGSTTGLNTPAASTQDIYIGVYRYNSGTNMEYLNGYIDGLRITKGVNRYLPYKPVTPPTRELDGAGLLDDYVVLNFDGNLTDLSGLSWTAAGDAAISTTQRRFGSHSLALDGNGDYLYATTSSDLDILPNGDFTVEAWVYLTGTPDASYGDVVFSADTATQGWQLRIMPTGGMAWVYPALQASATTGGTFSQNRWYHVGVCRKGTQHYMFIDGLVYPISISNRTTTSATVLRIGSSSNSGAAPASYGYFQGYIDGVRLTRGYARFPRTFTPGPPAELPTAPEWVDEFSTINFENGLTDASGKTWSGTASTSTAKKKFGSTSLQLSNNYVACSQATTLTGDFTLSCWVYIVSATTHDIFKFGDESAGRILFRITSGNVLSYAIYGGATPSLGSDTITTGVWTHIMYVRSGTTVMGLINGKYSGFAAASGTLGNANTLRLGDTTGNCYIDGVVLNTTKYDPWMYYKPIQGEYLPIQETNYQNHTYDLARLSFDPDSTGQIYDHTGTRWAKSGSAALSTFAKWGGGSINFTGSTADYIRSPSNPAYTLGTDTFSIEMWVYAGNVNLYNCIFNNRWPTGAAGIALYFGGSAGADNGKLVLADNAAVVARWGVLTNSTWTHIALTRVGNTIKTFINGGYQGSYTDARSYAGTYFLIGTDTGNTGSSFYVDGFRITRGLNKRPTLTAPSEELQPDYFTISLLPFEGTNGETSTTDLLPNSWTFTGSAQISTAQSKWGSSSCSFDGSGSYISSTGFAFGTDDFTIEGWVRWSNPDGSAQKGCLQFCGASGLSTSSTTTIALFPNTGSVWAIYGGGGITSTGITITSNTWYHFAIVRRSDILRLFIDGTVIIQKTDTVNYTGGYGVLGGYFSTSYCFPGYLDGVRVSKGIARYVQDFVVPAAPPRNYNPYGSSVEHHFPGNGINTGTVIVDSTGGKYLYRGAVTTSTGQGRFRSSSLYFSGSAHLKLIRSTLALAQNDFTLEAWLYSNTTGAWTRFAESSPFNSATQGWNISFNGTDGAGSRRIGWQLSKSGGGGDRLESDAAFPNATWAHLALVRKNNVGYMFINGSIQSTTLNLASETWNTTTWTYGCTVDTLSNNFAGYMQDIRLTKGQALYLPASEMVAPEVIDYSSVALLNFDGDLTDECGNTWTPYGDAAVSTTQKKFGSHALYLDGVGDYIATPYSSNYDLSTCDFTVEAWVHAPLTQSGTIVSKRYDSANGWVLHLDSTGAVLLRASIGGSWSDTKITTGAGSVTANTWTHIALERRNSTFTIYINRRARGTLTDSNAVSDQGEPLRIGIANYAGENPFKGYIDGFHFCKKAIYGPPMIPMPQVSE